MSSPVFPLKSNIQISKDIPRPVYLQLCDQVISLIKSGKLAAATKLPGTRKLSEDLSLHRKTIVAAYQELVLQGWIESIPSRGTFVSKDLPLVKPKKIEEFGTHKTTKNNCTTGFTFLKKPLLERKYISSGDTGVTIADGVPDHRLAPIDDISRTYRNLVKKTYNTHLLTYDSIYGNLELRKTLISYLNQTRGIQITVDNILITRGSQMGIYLASKLLLPGQSIICGSTNYLTADHTFLEAGAHIKRVSVDASGINTNEIEAICKKDKIRAVYVTSHHHYPTTVTLTPERRIHLLQLASQYQFAIIEDDYDYDFHYNNAPILPLGSNDTNGNVIYIGGFTKIIAPALRVGYLIGPKEFVKEAANLRRIIDRQGDTLLEQTLAIMIKNGDVQRHSNKVKKIYKRRRDLFCQLLKEKLGDYFHFEIPKGGMAVWVYLDKKYSWNSIIEEAQKRNIAFTPDWKRFDNEQSGHNGIRMGFASLNEEEIISFIGKLQNIMRLF